jgi:hypothetical protein
MAAVLACGEAAALSHCSAAALLGIGIARPGVIDVSVRRRCELRRPGMRIRGRPTLAAVDIVLFDDISVTGAARTLVDIAAELGPIVTERAVNDADKRDLIDPGTLRSAIDRYPGEPGVRPLRQLLDKLTFRLAVSSQQTVRQQLRGRLLLA